MGWSAGSSVAEPLIKVIKENVENIGKRIQIYEVLLETLTDADWDTVEECFGIDPIFDDVCWDAGYEII